MGCGASVPSTQLASAVSGNGATHGLDISHRERVMKDIISIFDMAQLFDVERAVQYIEQNHLEALVSLTENKRFENTDVYVKLKLQQIEDDLVQALSLKALERERLNSIIGINLTDRRRHGTRINISGFIDPFSPHDLGSGDTVVNIKSITGATHAIRLLLSGTIMNAKLRIRRLDALENKWGGLRGRNFILLLEGKELLDNEILAECLRASGLQSGKQIDMLAVLREETLPTLREELVCGLDEILNQADLSKLTEPATLLCQMLAAVSMEEIRSKSGYFADRLVLSPVERRRFFNSLGVCKIKGSGYSFRLLYKAGWDLEALNNFGYILSSTEDSKRLEALRQKESIGSKFEGFFAGKPVLRPEAEKLLDAFAMAKLVETELGIDDKSLKELLPLYNKSCHLFPSNADMQARLGFVEQILGGKTADGLPHIRRALELDSAHPLALTFLSLYEQDLRNYSEAERLLRKALEYDPVSLMAHSNLGVILETHSDNKTGALKEYEMAASCDPDCCCPDTCTVLFNIARFYEFELNDLDMAEVCWKRAAKANEYRARYYLALLLGEKKNRWAEAVQEMRQAAVDGHTKAQKELESFSSGGDTKRTK